jgi:NDP-sugar pyrophosphorylase family protein
MTSSDAYNIAENQGIDPIDIFNGEFFLYEVTKIDSKVHAGETYGIPRSNILEGKEGLYELGLNGALIHESVEALGANLEGRVIVHSNSRIGRGSHIGKAAVVGRNVRIDDDVHVGKKSTISSYATIEAGANIGPKVQVGVDAIVGAAAILGRGATVPDGGRVAAGEVLGPWKKVPNVNTSPMMKKLGRAADLAYIIRRYLLHNETMNLVDMKAIKSRLSLKSQS